MNYGRAMESPNIKKIQKSSIPNQKTTITIKSIKPHQDFGLPKNQPTPKEPPKPPKLLEPMYHGRAI